MIIGIGCDIVEHEMTKKLNWETDQTALERIFSPKELNIFSEKKGIRFLAGRFAVKEAVLKCLGTGMYDGLSLLDIQTHEGELGKPELEITGEIKELSDRLGINLWYISISHSQMFSFAVAIAERREI